MTTKCYDSLSFISSKIFEIDQAEIFTSHRHEHLEIMRLSLCNMCKEEICFSGNESSLIDLFYTHEDVAIAKIFFKGNIEIFIFFIRVAPVIAWLNKEFNIGIKLLKRYNLRRCKWYPSVGRVLCFTEYPNS